MILLADGSLTHTLQTLTGFPVVVDCLETKQIPKQLAWNSLPDGVQNVSGEVLAQRQVLLRSGDPNNTPYVFALSWWNAATFDKYLQDKKKPIWKSLSEGRTEIYREIKRVFKGKNQQLEQFFGTEDVEFWGREYYFWHRGEILTMIYEVFSPELQRFLGPYQNKEITH
eukprot:TRINITY_DN5176_c0_g1_i1.p2 TRINITY_DN5176_c0_g1~~TRINITY_DN5176_c0_g1_i1.p2  ORF type:complete len:181 (+),score=20.21 TRINITY_DN5176_c0_g1_i1:38-544(+)